MVEFPLVWLISVLASVAAVALVQSPTLLLSARLYLCAFLGAVALLAGLLGLRLAQWVDWANQWQPVVAVIVAPLAYLGFRALTRKGLPGRKMLVLTHAVPILLVQVAFLSPLLLPVDEIILVINVIYTAKLIGILRLPADEFPHTPPNGMRMLRLSLVGAIALLILMISADLIIIAAFMVAGNDPAMEFVSGASGFFTVYICLAAMIGLSLLMRGGQAVDVAAQKPVVPSDQDETLLAETRDLLLATGLYRDSSVTLARLSRRLGHPARDISNAINRCTGENFSRFINGFRIEHASKLLKETDLPITEIMLEAGFVSKSSFNTEFKRIVGQTPSQFRAERPN